jgi:Arc/MetJ family transcription regulator
VKTTIDIPDEALREAMRFTKAKTKREAILTALDEFNRRRRMAELVKFSGTCKEMMSFEELMELRERDLPKAARLYSK